MTVDKELNDEGMIKVGWPPLKIINGILRDAGKWSAAMDLVAF